MWEIFYLGSGKSEVLSEAQARKLFGTREWKEIKMGYLPHIIACKLES